MKSEATPVQPQKFMQAGLDIMLPNIDTFILFILCDYMLR